MFKFILLFPFIVFANSNDQLSKLINNSIVSSGIPKSSLSISIGELNSSQDFVNVNANKKMIPASVSKIVTAAASLSLFPHEITFNNELLVDQNVEDNLLNSNLYLVGRGDPAVVEEDLWLLANNLYQKGIRRINGDLVFDDSYFDGVRLDPSRDHSPTDQAYAAPVSALSLNWNSVSVDVIPQKVGDRPLVVVPNSKYYMQIENTASVVSGNKNNLSVSRVVQSNGDLIRISGSIGISAKNKSYYKSISKPSLWTASYLVDTLERVGIEFNGQIRKAKAPKTAISIYKIPSKDLSLIAKYLMKYSNNFVAEMLAKNLSAYINKKQATMGDGISLIRTYLTTMKWNSDSYDFISPSGLSQRNRIPSKNIRLLLNDISKDFKIYPEFLSSLPVAGVDGTLSDRLDGKETSYWVRAKTGTLNNSTALAGFAHNSSGNTYSFSFIYNGSSGQRSKAIELFDRIASILVTGKNKRALSLKPFYEVLN